MSFIITGFPYFADGMIFTMCAILCQGIYSRGFSSYFSAGQDRGIAGGINDALEVEWLNYLYLLRNCYTDDTSAQKEMTKPLTFHT